DGGAEKLRAFELERIHLQHEKVEVLRLVGDGTNRPRLVTGEDDLAVIVREHPFEEFGGRALAVRAGDGDGKTARLLEPEFEFADDRDLEIRERFDERRLRGHGG